MAESAIIARVISTLTELPAADWDALLARQSQPTPFMRHAYLSALHDSGSASPETGWQPCFMTLWEGDVLVAACPLYAKDHSYGEYVFDWAWAKAYQEHGLPYYPKAVVAVPFTPVPGSRLLARDAATRELLVRALCQWCEQAGLSSAHVLFASDEDMAACEAVGLMQRQTVQFHWKNVAPTLRTGVSSLPPEGAGLHLGRPGGESVAPTLHTGVSSLPPEGAGLALGPDEGYRDFEDFLASLTQEKRKKIRQERRRVAEAGVTFRWALGADISAADWDFFYQCYERTYREHGNPPYLTRDFFARMASDMPGAWLLFTAERSGQPIATSLIAIQQANTPTPGQNGLKTVENVAYGRYWGALERVDNLHFEACYYQPMQWCIEHGVQRFEGGAQGEHKMARALMPVATHSAHWLAHPGFADAVDRFLQREGEGVDRYLEHLHGRTPFKQAD